MCSQSQSFGLLVARPLLCSAQKLAGIWGFPPNHIAQAFRCACSDGSPTHSASCLGAQRASTDGRGGEVLAASRSPWSGGLYVTHLPDCSSRPLLPELLQTSLLQIFWAHHNAELAV